MQQQHLYILNVRNLQNLELAADLACDSVSHACYHSLHKSVVKQQFPCGLYKLSQNTKRTPSLRHKSGQLSVVPILSK